MLNYLLSLEYSEHSGVIEPGVTEQVGTELVLSGIIGFGCVGEKQGHLARGNKGLRCHQAGRPGAGIGCGLLPSAQGSL